MLTPAKYTERIIDSKIKEYLGTFGAICIEGPKWCGKTWAALNQSKSVCYISDPSDNFQNRRKAQLNPELVLAGDAPRLIDEWQEVPPIWDAVRFNVDKLTEKGRFILTGSATPNHKGILHSGAGRIGKIRMNTMTLYETGDSDGKVSLKSVLSNNIEATNVKAFSLDEIAYLCIRGGWPGSIGLSERKARNITTQYLDAVIADDMYQVDNIKRDERKVKSLLHSLARNESTIASNQVIKKDIEAYDKVVIDKNTIPEYLDTLNRLFLIDEQLAFNPSLRSSRRVLQSPKRHYVDVSLATAAMGATLTMLLSDLNTLGFLFEALCEHDLKVYAEILGGSLFHFRDDRGNEIDAVIELPDGTWGAFEIKLGMDRVDDAAKKLLKIKKIFDNEGIAPSSLCVITGMSNVAYTREDGVHVVPISALKN